jgi:uncharacterized protein (TIGR02284 family)
MNNKKSIDILNTLIGINNDRIEGYEAASTETEEPDLIKLFTQLVASSDECNAELVEEVEKMGGTPAEGTKTTGKFFRAWMDFQVALSGKDRKTILDSCEYGEEVTVNTYKKVLENCAEDLTVEQLSMARDQCAWLKADHDTVKALRNLLVESDV